MLSKQNILEEIRKEARENGDVPLSTERFEEKTGIKPYYWHKYWARFGDAQREAGFSPNAFFKTPYDHQYLCAKFIELMRELRKWPTKGEIEVKHNTDSKFPGSHTFYRNLGQIKQNLVNTICEYAKNKNYKDILQLCNAELLNKKEKDSGDSNFEEGVIAYVYLAKSGGNYKIGRTKNIDRRRDDITLLLPERVEVVHKIETDDSKGIEAYWHKRFNLKRKRGEWFDLNSSDVKAFKRWRRIA